MDIEFKSSAEITALQTQLLREQVQYNLSHSPYYKNLFQRLHLTADDIQSIEDLQKLPFTTKDDLQRENDNFLACERTKVIDYVSTSGTTGSPVQFYCTDKDLERLAYNESKSFACAGLTQGDVLQLMVTMDKRFMAGLAYFLGLRKLGCGVIRVGNGIPELQWDSILRLKPTAIMCVPSFILRLIEYAESAGIDYRSSSICKIIGIGEGMRGDDLALNLLGKRIKEKWDVQLYATYSSTEMSATFSECEHGCGGHVHPELIITEIIDEAGSLLPDGQVGELVVTTLGVEGMPLMRFKTGDLVYRMGEPCACGRSSYRLSPVIGRKAHLIKLKGTTLYPPAISDLLSEIDYISQYQITVASDKITGTDRVLIRISLKHPVDFDVVKHLKDRFRARIRVAPDIEICSEEMMLQRVFPAKSRKPIRFSDERTY